MKITVVATRPETIEFSTTEVTGDQHIQNHIGFFASDAPAAEKVRVATFIARHMSAFWGAINAKMAAPPTQPEATPSPETEEEKA